uniref:Putative product n=1 Tax=Xenopsylla cheopis TaxID=163159 RepID=A0A6M2DTI2_XENCH
MSPGLFHVYNFVFLFLNHVFVTIRSCLLQKSTSILSRTFLFPSPCAPTIFSSGPALSTLLKYPIITTFTLPLASRFRMSSISSFRISYLFHFAFFMTQLWNVHLHYYDVHWYSFQFHAYETVTYTIDVHHFLHHFVPYHHCYSPLCPPLTVPTRVVQSEIIQHNFTLPLPPYFTQPISFFRFSYLTTLCRVLTFHVPNQRGSVSLIALLLMIEIKLLKYILISISRIVYDYVYLPSKAI